jgi:hypothetical protein
MEMDTALYLLLGFVVAMAFPGIWGWLILFAVAALVTWLDRPQPPRGQSAGNKPDRETY